MAIYDHFSLATDKKDIGVNTDLVLLLDEPGLSLHALGQADFLRYIDHLSNKHQIIYTTHSPFMIEGSKLHRVRTVEDLEKSGSVVSSDLVGSSTDTLFPLQAALGYSIAQNLFIAERNLLVEGVSDLVLLQMMSTLLDKHGWEGLDDSIVITPVGGLKRVPAFVSLFGANELDLVVLHDWEGKQDQQISDMIRKKLLHQRRVINYAQFRDDKAPFRPTDLEDLLPVPLYLEYFNKTYAAELNGVSLTASSLPMGDRIIDRINRFLETQGIRLRPTGGFNHYRVAREFAARPPAFSKVKGKTVERFALLFQTVNALFFGPQE